MLMSSWTLPFNSLNPSLFYAIQLFKDDKVKSKKTKKQNKKQSKTKPWASQMLSFNLFSQLLLPRPHDGNYFPKSGLKGPQGRSEDCNEYSSQHVFVEDKKFTIRLVFAN